VSSQRDNVQEHQCRQSAVTGNITPTSSAAAKKAHECALGKNYYYHHRQSRAIEYQLLEKCG